MHDFQIPNLDCISENDLCFVETVCKHVASYAVLKRQAMTHRRKGEIESALFLEDHADFIYSMLPEDIRW